MSTESALTRQDAQLTRAAPDIIGQLRVSIDLHTKPELV